MDSSINETLIFLIPKSPNAFHIRNFGPIGLCNTLYKLITIIIILRIKTFLPNIIWPIQASFIANRRASKNAIIVQEYITHFKKIKGKQGNMILKINLEKAFDRIK